jgi:rubrerythrin
MASNLNSNTGNNSNNNNSNNSAMSGNSTNNQQNQNNQPNQNPPNQPNQNSSQNPNPNANLTSKLHPEGLGASWRRTKCMVCGYVHEGQKVLKKCPKCGNEDPDKFQETD